MARRHVGVPLDVVLAGPGPDGGGAGVVGRERTITHTGKRDVVPGRASIRRVVHRDVAIIHVARVIVRGPEDVDRIPSRRRLTGIRRSPVRATPRRPSNRGPAGARPVCGAAVIVCVGGRVIARVRIDTERLALGRRRQRQQEHRDEHGRSHWPTPSRVIFGAGVLPAAAPSTLFTFTSQLPGALLVVGTQSPAVVPDWIRYP